MGSGFRSFAFGEVLTSANVQNYLMDQAVTVFAGTAARGSAITSPETGMVSYRTDGTADSKREGFEFYDGSAWTRMIPAATTPGLVCVKSETAFSTASSITADNVFTSTYTNYQLVVRYISSGTNNLLLRLRASGTSAATNYNFQRIYASNTTVAGERSTSQTSFFAAPFSNGTFYITAVVFLSGPQLAEATIIHSENAPTLGAYTSLEWNNCYGNHSTATAYDGIEIFTASGSLTGSYTIYGMSKS